MRDRTSVPEILHQKYLPTVDRIQYKLESICIVFEGRKEKVGIEEVKVSYYKIYIYVSLYKNNVSVSFSPLKSKFQFLVTCVHMCVHVRIYLYCIRKEEGKSGIEEVKVSYYKIYIYIYVSLYKNNMSVSFSPLKSKFQLLVWVNYNYLHV